MWIWKGMKMVSIHDTVREAMIIDKKVDIYPRFLLAEMAQKL